MKNNLRIGLDLDQVLDDFMGPYIEKFGNPKSDYEITKNVQRKLSKDRDFWLNLPVINRIDFIPELYCSKRVNPKQWSKQWLNNNGFPDRPFYQMLYQKGNKATMIKGRVDVFIDDSIDNFIKINNSGVPCLLLNNEYNKDFCPILKVFSLNLDEIKYVYKLAQEFEIFRNFKKYISET
jgi:hypothetical protein